LPSNVKALSALSAWCDPSSKFVSLE